MVLRFALRTFVVASVGLFVGGVARAQDDAASGAALAQGDAAGGAELSHDAEGATGLAVPRARVPRCAVVDTLGMGVDPVVAPHVTARIRTTVESMGYTLVVEPALGDAERAVRMGLPPTPADLWRVTFVSHASRGVFARVYAASGQYVVEMLVASVDGTGPFVDRATAGASNLLDVVEALVRRLLPPAAVFDADAAARLADAARPSTTTPPLISQPPSFRVLGPGAFGFPAFGSATPGPASLTPNGPLIPLRRFAISIGADVSFGTTDDRFRNGFVDARFEYRVTRDFLVLAQVSYANLQGRTQRVSNILPMAGLETRIRVISDDGVSIPLRATVGYLPYNGVVLRLAGGLNIPIKERIELGFDLLTPTFWFLATGRVISFDLAASVIYRFGPIKRDDP